MLVFLSDEGLGYTLPGQVFPVFSPESSNTSEAGATLEHGMSVLG